MIDDQDASSTETSSHNDAEQDLTTGALGKHLLSMSAPTFLGMIALNSVAVVDAYFIGQLGTLPLAAITFCFPIIGFISSVVHGLSNATQSVVSQASGDRNFEKSQRITLHTLLLTVILCGVLIAVGVSLLVPTARLIGAESDTLPFVQSYMHIWFAGVLFQAIPYVAGASLMARGDAKTPMYAMVGGAIVNAILDPILIFGLGFIPAMGIAGAATASVVSRVLVATAILWLLVSRNLLRLDRNIFENFWNSSTELVKIAVPAAGNNVIVPATTGILTRLCSQFGEPVVAAYGAGTRIQSLITLVFVSMAIGTQSVVGQNWGAGLKERVLRTLHLSQVSSTAWGVISWVGFTLYGSVLAVNFVEGAQAAEYLALFLAIVPAGYAAWGVTMSCHGTLLAINRASTSGVISAVRAFLLITPLAWIGSIMFGVPGLFAGIVAGYTGGAIIRVFLTRYYVQVQDTPR